MKIVYENSLSLHLGFRWNSHEVKFPIVFSSSFSIYYTFLFTFLCIKKIQLFQGIKFSYSEIIKVMLN